MSEVLIKTTDLHCGYGGVDIVKGINIEVKSGEVVALLGANGAGKTTTMLTLAGELSPISGEAAVLDLPKGRPLYKRARKGLSFVTEERSIFPHLTTKQNLAVGRVNIEHATEIFPELLPLLGRRAGLLSGGEQQMLTLSRAISRNPKLLLADELSLGLAPKTVGRLLRAVRAAADQGVGALLIEQHVNRVLDIADRVYLLHHGVIEFEGTADEARANMSRIQATYLSAG